MVMRHTAASTAFLMGATLAASCNAVIGADEPVIDEPAETAGASGGSGTFDVPVGNAHQPECGDGLIGGEEQ
jgi:predicted small secreted protein